MEKSDCSVWNIAKPSWCNARQDRILHPQAFSPMCPFMGVVVLRVEGLRCAVILINGYVATEGQTEHTTHKGPRQFVAALTAVSPMYKHPETGGIKPGIHALECGGVSAFECHCHDFST